MRISDWSSDVCSSDLFLDTADQHHPLLRLIHDEIEELRGAGEVLAKRLRTRIEVDEDKAAILIEQRQRLELVKRVSLEVRRIGFRSVQDRKSVVWGKSVSVGVDSGGGRIIKKKTC